MRDESAYKKVFTPAQAKLKAESYCAYQERSQQEIRDKLYEWGLHHDDTERIISELISANFLNEERFALAYTLGKFRIKQWGKIRIKQGLKLKKVPDKMISKSLNAIDPEDYVKNLHRLIIKKSATLKESDSFKRRISLHRYAASKGYEQELIADVIRDIEF